MKHININTQSIPIPTYLYQPWPPSTTAVVTTITDALSPLVWLVVHWQVTYRHIICGWHFAKHVVAQKVTPAELEGDGAESLIMELCRWASSRPIPLSFDDNLQRKKTKNGTTCNRLLQPVTLVKYIGKHIKYCRKVYPDHPDWKHLNPNCQDAVPQWWTELSPLFKKSARNFMLQYQGDTWQPWSR